MVLSFACAKGEREKKNLCKDEFLYVDIIFSEILVLLLQIVFYIWKEISETRYYKQFSAYAMKSNNL